MRLDARHWTLAEQIARDLYDRETDVNEVLKVVTYARIHRDGKRVFDLLETMARDGRYLVRSGRTMDYYRDLRDVCTGRLREYQTASDEKAQELVWILASAARLMRYYDTDEGNAEFNARQRAEPLPPSYRRLEPEVRPAPARPLPKPAPRTETRREWVTLAGVVSAGKAPVRTEAGAQIPCTAIPFFQIDERLRADVTYQNGTPVRAIFKSWK